MLCILLFVFGICGGYYLGRVDGRHVSGRCEECLNCHDSRKHMPCERFGRRV
jgi:hypothetical protein